MGDKPAEAGGGCRGLAALVEVRGRAVPTSFPAAGSPDSEIPERAEQGGRTQGTFG